jgi:hypothetical protein
LIATQIATMPRGNPTFGAQENDQHPVAALAISQETAAKIMAVGERTVQRAKRIREHASPEVLQAVKAGKLSLHLAEKAMGLWEPAGPRTKTGRRMPTRVDAVKANHAWMKEAGRQWKRMQEGFDIILSLPLSRRTSRLAAKAPRGAALWARESTKPSPGSWR